MYIYYYHSLMLGLIGTAEAIEFLIYGIRNENAIRTTRLSNAKGMYVNWNCFSSTVRDGPI